MDFPPAYYSHPLAQHAIGPVCPVAIFIDAVPYSHTDSIIGWWVINLVTGRRHLFCTLRKKSCCKCGCRGWCTFHVVFAFLRWSLEAAAKKRHPAIRQDGQPWTDADVRVGRGTAADTEMSCAYCVMYVKGDWAEYAGIVGFLAWNDGVRPCFKCDCDGWNMQDLTGINPQGLGEFTETTADAYEEACRRCEKHLVMDKRTHAILCPLLESDQKRDGCRGFGLSHDPCLAALGLAAGDRLEPSNYLLDVTSFWDIVQFPHPVLFWTRGEEGLTRHRNPLLSSRVLGISCVNCMVDILHTLYLGLFNVFCRIVVWSAFRASIWARASTIEELVEASLVVMRDRYRRWFSNRRRQSKEGLTEVCDITRKMVGSVEAPQLKLKGAETWSFLLFLKDELEKDSFRLLPNHDRFLAASRCLVGLVQTWKAAAWRMTEGEIETCFGFFNRFVAVTSGVAWSEELAVPKRHLWIHVMRDMIHFGNPRYFACWVDEADNKQLKQCCRHVHQVNFDVSVLSGMRSLAALRSK